jgi:hypothetical protein
MTEPLPVMVGPPPQIRVTITPVVPPAVTLNGVLVPRQETPALVVAVMVSVSPVLAGQLVSTDAVAFASLVLIVPEASVALLAELIVQFTDEIVAPFGSVRFIRIDPTFSELLSFLEQLTANPPAPSVTAARKVRLLAENRFITILLMGSTF